MIKRLLAAGILFLGLGAAVARAQGVQDEIIGTDFGDGARNATNLNRIINDVALSEGTRKVRVVLDGGQWEIDDDVELLEYIELYLPYGSSLDIHTNQVLDFNGCAFSALNDPVFFGTGIATGCINVAISFDDPPGQWTNSFAGRYYIQNCAALISSDDITSVDGDTIEDASLCGEDIGPECITITNMADDSVCSDQIGDGCVALVDLNPEVLALITNESEDAVYYAYYHGTNETITSINNHGSIASLATTTILSNELTIVKWPSSMVGSNFRFTPATGKTYRVEIWIDTWTDEAEAGFIDAFAGISLGLAKNGETKSLTVSQYIGSMSEAVTDGSTRVRSTAYLNASILGNGTDFYDPFISTFAAEGARIYNMNEYMISIKEAQ